MKKKYRILISILCMVCLTFAAAAFAACGNTEEEKSITFTASALAEAQVGVAYSASVATATGVDGITYTVKDDTPLPSGLTLSAAGAISGTPTAAVEVKCTIVASAAGVVSAETEFTIVVKPAELSEADGVVFEAEQANLSKTTYTAVSYSPLKLYSTASASGGKYLGDLGQKGCTVRFEFDATEAGKATLFVTMRSIPAVPFTVEPEVLLITVNDVEKKYNKTTLPTSFTEFQMRIDLQKGHNVIDFVTTDNTKMMENNVPLMPNFDCIRVKPETGKVSWTPNLDNF